MANTETKAYHIDVMNPLFSPRATEIGIDPKAMWDIIRERSLSLGDLGNGWECIFPEGQNVPDESDGVHVMIAPRMDTFVKLTDFGFEELSIGTSFILKFVKSASGLAIAGWNISNEPPGRRSQPQSWPNFHFHCIKYPDDISKLDYTPPDLIDYGYSLFEPILEKYIAFNDLVTEEIERVELQNNSFQPYFPRGGLMYRLSDSTTPQAISRLIKSFDEQYREAHQEFFSLFVSNYEEVRGSNWAEPYKLRSEEEVKRLMDKSKFDQTQQVKLLLVFKLLKPETEVDSNRLIYRSPAYTGSLFKDNNGQIYIFFHPFISRPGGFPHSLGIEIIRKSYEGISLKQRRERAERLYNYLLSE